MSYKLHRKPVCRDEQPQDAPRWRQNHLTRKVKVGAKHIVNQPTKEVER
jgi:hypothetical protein